MAEMQTADSGGGKHKKGGQRSKKMSTRVDMTPMVDLAFLLVTFFMLTTTFNKPTVMDIKMPAKTKDKQDQTDVKESESMTVIMAGGDTLYYFIGISNPELVQTSYSADGIRKVIANKRTEVQEANSDRAVDKRDRLTVLLKATKTATFKNIVDMFDEMSIVGVPTYALVDLNEFDQGLIDKKLGKAPAESPK